jgi:fucose 4-O-acetylase-like acetyltransferase
VKNGFSESIAEIKGVAILLVVLGHLTSPLGPAIFSFHIPLFFFLGGIFIKAEHGLAAFLRKNFVRLILPFLLCGAFGILTTAVKNIVLHRPVEKFTDSFSGLLIWMDHPHLQHYGYVLWFLPALFWARLFCVLLDRYLKINAAFTLFLLMACSYFCSYSFAGATGIELPFCLDEAIVALPWVYFGAVFYKYREKLLNLPGRYFAGMALILGLILFFGLMPHIDLADKKIDNIFITMPYTFFAIGLIVWMTVQTYCLNLRAPDHPGKTSRLIATLGWQSMLIYVAHVYTNTAAYLLTDRLFGNGYWYVVFPMSTAMLMALVWCKLRRPELFLFRYL